MAIDIYNTRRCNFAQCLYWNRNERNIDDDDILKYNIKPDGLFYAREISGKTQSSNDVSNVWQVKTEKINLETTDIINIEKNALVKFEGEMYVVDYVEQRCVHKRQEFGGCGSSKITTIYLRR